MNMHQMVHVKPANFIHKSPTRGSTQEGLNSGLYRTYGGGTKSCT